MRRSEILYTSRGMIQELDGTSRNKPIFVASTKKNEWERVQQRLATVQRKTKNYKRRIYRAVKDHSNGTGRGCKTWWWRGYAQYASMLSWTKDINPLLPHLPIPGSTMLCSPALVFSALLLLCNANDKICTDKFNLDQLHDVFWLCHTWKCLARTIPG